MREPAAKYSVVGDQSSLQTPDAEGSRIRSITGVYGGNVRRRRDTPTARRDCRRVCSEGQMPSGGKWGTQRYSRQCSDSTR
eukprot:8375037-Heterocapsa_arctica.AAC.1